MISRCARCGERIRDCTGFARSGYVLVTVPDWYHIATGWRTCPGGRAWPVLCVDVICPAHDKEDPACRVCDIASQVSLFFHNDGRCIEALCRYPHA